MSPMKAVQVSSPGGDFQIVEREIPKPKAREVLIKVQACGICHSDLLVKEGVWPGLQYPRVPGHEVIGVVAGLGSEVKRFKEGDPVGVGWHGGHCFECGPCRAGDFIHCEQQKIMGISYDGGWASHTVVPQEAVARVPEGMPVSAAAPLMCAGITTFNSLRNSGARPGDVVAVQGIGGLGHLALQFSRKMGFHTVAISSGADKEDLAKELGAHHYIDASAGDPVQALKKLGGAKLILATAPNSKVISPLVDGLGIGGKLWVVAADMSPLEISPIQLIMGRKSIQGWPSGTAKDSEDTLRFSQLEEIYPMVETFPLERAGEAYERMITNQARFRVVLEP